MERKFKILRLIGSIYKILGIIAAVFTLIGALAICGVSVAGTALATDLQNQLGMTINSAVAGVIVAATTLFSGGISALVLYAMGEGIFLLLALEENTRKTAYLMQQYSTEPIVPEV